MSGFRGHDRSRSRIQINEKAQALLDRANDLRREGLTRFGTRSFEEHGDWFKSLGQVIGDLEPMVMDPAMEPGPACRSRLDALHVQLYLRTSAKSSYVVTVVPSDPEVDTDALLQKIADGEPFGYGVETLIVLVAGLGIEVVPPSADELATLAILRVYRNGLLTEESSERWRAIMEEVAKDPEGHKAAVLLVPASPPLATRLVLLSRDPRGRCDLIDAAGIPICLPTDH